MQQATPTAPFASATHVALAVPSQRGVGASLGAACILQPPASHDHGRCTADRLLRCQQGGVHGAQHEHLLLAASWLRAAPVPTRHAFHAWLLQVHIVTRDVLVLGHKTEEKGQTVHSQTKKVRWKASTFMPAMHIW